MSRLSIWWRRNKEVIMIVLIGLIVAIVSISALIYFDYRADKNDYYSYSIIIINNVEYKTEDTDFMFESHGHLAIELKDGTRIETSDYILKK